MNLNEDEQNLVTVALNSYAGQMRELEAASERFPEDASAYAASAFKAEQLIRRIEQRNAA